VFAEDFSRRRTVVEEVIDARDLDAVAAGGREIEAPGAGASVEFAVAGGGDQERDGGGDGLAGEVELRIGTRTQAVEAFSGRLLPVPCHGLPGRGRLGEILHQGLSLGAKNREQQPVLPDDHLEGVRADVERAGGIVDVDGDRPALGMRQRGQRPFERAPEAERAVGIPLQLGAAVVQRDFDAVAVGGECEQRGHRGQGLRGHQRRTISRWISPVTRASETPANMSISLRTPKSGR
jgi:hypothetical protein